MSSDEGKLFVGGLSFDTTEHSLEQAFGKFGVVCDAVVVKDRETNRSRGFGFVTFRNPQDAKDALQSMNGESLDGRQIRVDLAGKSSGWRPGWWIRWRLRWWPWIFSRWWRQLWPQWWWRRIRWFKGLLWRIPILQLKMTFPMAVFIKTLELR